MHRVVFIAQIEDRYRWRISEGGCRHADFGLVKLSFTVDRDLSNGDGLIS
jgi:hypothetical protein